MADYQGLTIKLGADVSAVVKSMSSVKSETKLLMTDLKAVNNALKWNPDSVDLLKTKVANFQRQVELNNAQISEWQKEMDGLKGKTDAISVAKMQDLGQKIEQARQKNDVLNKSIDATNKTINEVQDPKSLTNLSKQSVELQGDLDLVNKKLQLDPKNVDLAKEKMQIMGQQVQNAKDKVETLKTAQSALGSENIGTPEWKALESQIVDAQLEVKNFESNIKNVGKSSESLPDVGKKLDFANLMNASQALQPIAGGLKSIGESAMDASKEANSALNIIVSKTGETKDQYREMLDKITSKIPVDNYDDVGTAIGGLRSSFQMTGDQLQNTSVQFLQFSKLTGTDLQTNIDNAKQSMGAFGMTTKDVPNIMNEVLATSQKTGVGVTDLFNSVNKGAPTLQQFGLNFKDSTTLMAGFSMAGLDGDKAMSALTKSAGVYAKQGKNLSAGLADTAEKIKNAKTSTQALAEASAVFGSKQAPLMVQAIKEGKLNLSDFGKASKDAGDTVGTSFDKTQGSMAKVQVAQQEMKNSLAQVGSIVSATLAPILKDFADKLSGLVKWFNGLDDGTKKVIVTIGIILAIILTVIPTILGVVGAIKAINSALQIWQTITKIASAVQGAFNAVMSANPIGIVIVAIAALVAGLVWFFTQTKTGQKIWQDFMNWLKSAWQSISTFFTNLWNGIVNVFNGAVKSVQNFWNGLVSWFKSIPSKIANFFSGIGSSIGNFFNNAVNNVKTKFNALIDFVKNIPQNIANFFKSLPSKIGSAIGDLGKVGKDLLTSLIKGMGDIGSVIAHAIKTGVGNVGSFLKNALGFGKAFDGLTTDGLGAGIQSFYNLKNAGFMPAFGVTKNGSSTVSTQNFNFTINAQSNNPQNIATAIETQIVRRLRGR